MREDLEKIITETSDYMQQTGEKLDQQRLQGIRDYLKAIQDDSQLSQMLGYAQFTLDPEGKYGLLEKIGVSANHIKDCTIYGIRLTGDENYPEFLYLTYSGVFYGKTVSSRRNRVHKEMIFAYTEVPVEEWRGAVNNITADDIFNKLKSGIEGLYSRVTEKFPRSEDIQS